jgi:hypothetical protein
MQYIFCLNLPVSAKNNWIAESNAIYGGLTETMVDELFPQSSFEEKRAEPRFPADQFYSVEIHIPDLAGRYKFKLRDVSTSGMGIIVKDDSLLLGHLKIGNILKMLYSPTSRTAVPELLKTRIEHISKCESGRYKGHHIVGFSILEKYVSEQNQGSS